MKTGTKRDNQQGQAAQHGKNNRKRNNQLSRMRMRSGQENIDLAVNRGEWDEAGPRKPSNTSKVRANKSDKKVGRSRASGAKYKSSSGEMKANKSDKKVGRSRASGAMWKHSYDRKVITTTDKKTKYTPY